MPNKEHDAVRSEPILLADHPALDLLNTLPRVNGELVDFFQSDAEVWQWLARVGLISAEGSSRTPPAGLLEAARSLREVFRDLLQRWKTGEPGDLSTMNAFLEEAWSRPQLVRPGSGSLTIQRDREEATPGQVLGSLAEVAAELLVEGDRDLVKRCEDESCVLWFYDRTKSHHRRWCSMATCGNRHKVTAYRKRNLEKV